MNNNDTRENVDVESRAAYVVLVVRLDTTRSFLLSSVLMPFPVIEKTHSCFPRYTSDSYGSATDYITNLKI